MIFGGVAIIKFSDTLSIKESIPSLCYDMY